MNDNTSRTDEAYPKPEGFGAVVWMFRIVWTLFMFCAGFLAGRFM